MVQNKYCFIASLLTVLLLMVFAISVVVAQTSEVSEDIRQNVEIPDEEDSDQNTDSTKESIADTADISAVPIPTMVPVEAKEVPKPSPDARDEAIVMLEEGIALFELPAMESAVLAHLEIRSVLPLLHVGQTWSKVQYGEQAGYVPTYALSFGYGSPQPVIALVTAPGGKLTLRAQMTTKSKALGTIPSGRAVLLLSKSSPFSLVRYEGKEGYVLTEHLKEVAPNRQLGTLVEVVSITPDREANVRLRSEPSRKGTAYTTVKSGLSLVVISTLDDDWCQVEYEGFHGYMMTEYLRKFD